MTYTSNKFAKIVFIYNKYFFERMYDFMLSENTKEAFDGMDTLWHIDDVKKILDRLTKGNKNGTH